MNPFIAILSLILTAGIVSGQITQEMQQQFEKQIKVAVKKASIEEFYACCAWEGLSDDDIVRLQHDRKEIFARMLLLGPDITLIFHDPVTSRFKKADMRERLQGKSQLVPTPPAEMFVEVCPISSPTDGLLLPVTILHGQLKHIAWKKE